MDTEFTKGDWRVEQFAACPLPGYNYRVVARNPETGICWPVALVITSADAELIAEAPQLDRMIRQQNYLRHFEEVAGRSSRWAGRG